MAERIINIVWLLLLAAIAIADARKRIIPDALLVAGVVLCALQWLLVSEVSVLSGVIGAAVGFIFFLAVRLIGAKATGKDALGWGDVKLIALAGGYLGIYRLLVALLAGTLAGAVFAIAMFAIGKLKKTDELPFGPALCFGIALATLFGKQMIAWYVGLLV